MNSKKLTIMLVIYALLSVYFVSSRLIPEYRLLRERETQAMAEKTILKQIGVSNSLLPGFQNINQYLKKSRYRPGQTIAAKPLKQFLTLMKEQRLHLVRFETKEDRPSIELTGDWKDIILFISRSEEELPGYILDSLFIVPRDNRLLLKCLFHSDAGGLFL